MASDKLPISELVKRAKSTYNLSWADMGRELGRSPRMLRKLANEESAGESYRTSLTELYEKGRVETLPPRRRNKDGSLTKVRSKAGSKTPSIVPEDTRGKRVKGYRRGRYHSHPTQHLAGGGKLDRTDMPASTKSKARAKGWETIGAKIQRATRSQAQHDRRIKFNAVGKTSEGEYRRITIGGKGGFHASDVRSDIRKVHGGSTQDWFAAQVSAVYDGTDMTIVSVEQVEYNATRSKDIRKLQDATDTRRGANKRSWHSFRR